MHFPTLVRTRLEHIRNQRRSRAEIEQRQLAKLRRLVQHAVAHSPYYRDLVARHRIDVEQCRPQDFPELTKAGLIEHFDRIVTDPTLTRAEIEAFLKRSQDPSELFRGRYYVVYTSGTSGEPAYLVYSSEDWARGMAHSLRVNPPHLGRRRLAYFAWAQGHPAGAAFATCSQRWPLSLVYRLQMFHMNEPIAQVVAGLNAFGPTILMGYPSALLALAEEQQCGRLRIAPRWVQCSGEPIGSAGRQRLQSAFGVPLTNVYSSTEFLLMGFSRPELDGLYLFEDDLIFEIEPHGTLITNLFNKTMPLIRYRISDVLTPKSDTVGAYPFTKIAEVVGRGEVAASFRNRHGARDVVDAGQILGVAHPSVTGFQVLILGETACTLRIALRDGTDAAAGATAMGALRQELMRILAQKDMDNVQVGVEAVAELTRDVRTGKCRAVLHATDSPR